jgi:hypothetical protein
MFTVDWDHFYRMSQNSREWIVGFMALAYRLEDCCLHSIEENTLVAEYNDEYEIFFLRLMHHFVAFKRE